MKKNDWSIEDVDRYVDMVKEFGITKAQAMMKEIEKSKKKIKKGLKK